MILVVSINSINSTCDAEYKSIRVMGVTYPSNGLEQNLKPEHVAKLLNRVAPALYKQMFIGVPWKRPAPQALNNGGLCLSMRKKLLTI